MVLCLEEGVLEHPKHTPKYAPAQSYKYPDTCMSHIWHVKSKVLFHSLPKCCYRGLVTGSLDKDDANSSTDKCDANFSTVNLDYLYTTVTCNLHLIIIDN